MAGKLRYSDKGHGTIQFRHSHALVIGINDYRNGIRPLTTPVNDATRLAQLLENEHGYTVHLLVEDVRKERLAALFNTLSVGENDRLLFYFAGHGVALDGEDGPQGFLVPQDARADDRETLLPMTELNVWLKALPCRHMLAILDCCFAGAFRWAATRRLDTAALEVIHRERFERFIQSPAWQVLTSSAYNQTALDVVGGNAVGSRGIREEDGQHHSPFALALYDALSGEGDLIPKGDGDGVITATELYLYLRQVVEVGVAEAVNHEQTPGLWPLQKHDRGEFIFLTPGHALNLPPAPPLTDALNPWRGLKSYDQTHGNLFFGRDDEISELAQRVGQQPFTAVLGASGTGKSSLVKAGFLPHLAQQETDWRILQPLRPGQTPIANLRAVLSEELDISLNALHSDPQTLVAEIDNWHRGDGGKLLLVVDQLEELVTLADEATRAQFLSLLARAVEQRPDVFRLIVTLRTDFEPQFDANSPLAELWRDSRYVVPPFDQADLRQVIEGPASLRVLYFEPVELVDTLITEVLQTPGALPLLSFTLNEMYLHYLGRKGDDRALTQEDYDALGGVIGSLRNRANAEYDALPDDAHRETMRRVTLRMISVEGGELARRRVFRSELVYPTTAENDRVETVLNRLVAARLLVTGDDEGAPTIEPAHDALVLAWDKLLRWKQSAESYLPLQRRLAQAAVEWQSAATDARSGLLWDSDPRLPQLEETLWPTRNSLSSANGRLRWARQILLPDTATPADTRWLSGAEVAFVRESVQSRAQFWRRLVSGVFLFVIVLIGATVISFTFQRQAVASEQSAVAAGETAVAESTRAIRAEGTAVVEANLRATEVVSRTLAEEDALEQAEIAKDAQTVAEDEAARAQTQALMSLSVSLLPTGRDPTDDEVARSLLLSAHGISLSEQLERPVAARLVDEQARRLLDELNRGYVQQVFEGNASALAVDRQGEWLAATSRDGTVRLWSLGDLSGPPEVLEGIGDPLQPIAFDEAGKWLAAGSEKGVVYLWDMTSRAAGPLVLEGHQDGVRSVVFDPQEPRLATGGVDGTIRLWSLESQSAPPELLSCQEAVINSIVFGANGRWLAAGGGSVSYGGPQQTVCLWDLEDASSAPQVLTGPVDPIQAVAIDPEGRWLAAGGGNPFEGGDGSIYLWDLSESALRPRLLAGHTDDVRSMVFDPQGRWLASGGEDNDIRLWNLRNLSAAPRILEGHTNGVRSLVFDPEGRSLVSASSDETIRVWRLGGDFAEPRVLAGHENDVLAVAFDPAGRWLASAGGNPLGGGDTVIRLWELRDLGAAPQVLAGHETPVLSLAFDPQGHELASGSGSGEILLWKMSDLAAPPQVIEGHEGSVDALAFDPRGRWLASGGGQLLATDAYTSVIRLWNLDALTAAPQLLPANDVRVLALAFDAEGRRLASGGWDHQILLWNLDDLAAGAQSLAGHRAEVNATAFDPKGRWLASGSGDHTVRLWDVGDLSADPHVLDDHEERVESIAFGPLGRWLASGSSDYVIYLWDLDNLAAEPLLLRDDGDEGQMATFASLPRPGVDGVESLAFDPKGRLLASGYADGTVRLWRTVSELAALACEQAGRNFTWDEWQQFLSGEYEKTCPQYPVHCSVSPDAWPEEFLEERIQCSIETP